MTELKGSRRRGVKFFTFWALDTVGITFAFVAPIMIDRPRVLAAVLSLSLVASVSSAQVPVAPQLQASAAGSLVSASWTPAAGASSYRVEVGVSAGTMLYGQEVGALTSFSVNAPQGTFYLRVLGRNASGLGAPSNVVQVVVNGSVQPPPAPSNLQASVNGNTVTLTASLPGGLTGLLLQGGGSPGATQAVLPLAVSTQNVLPNVPPGTFYVRLVAVNAGGMSPPSNEVPVVVSAACFPPPAPTASAQTSGNTVGIGWTAVSGAAAYRLAIATTPGGAPAYVQTFGPGQTSVVYPGVPAGTYYARAIAISACGAQASSLEIPIVVTTPPGGNRTPNPPSPTPPNYLPLPDRSAVVAEMARVYAADLRNSCVDTGGNNIWLYRVVERLRREDTRWGLNWKRARVGDMSQDIITYNFGPESDEGTLFVHAVDVIGGHCGSNPSASWNNVTVLFSTGAKWTLQPYLAAGFPLNP